VATAAATAAAATLSGRSRNTWQEKQLGAGQPPRTGGVLL